MSASGHVNAKAQKRAKFEHVFTIIRDELVEYFTGQSMPKDATEWFTKVCWVVGVETRDKMY
jgi:hypothetical protein